MKCHRKLIVGVVGCALLVLFCTTVHAASAQADDALSSDISKAYAPLLAAYSKEFMGNPSADCIAFAVKNDMVSADLKTLLLKESAYKKKTRGVGHLDFDMFFNAQDDNEVPLRIVNITPEGGSYVMKVHNGFKGTKPYGFVLVQESGRWVIDDARYENGGKTVTLKNILKKP